MFTTKIETHQKAAAEAAGRARAIAEKAAAEGRDLTAAERSEYDASMSKGRAELEALKRAKADAAMFEEASGLGSPRGSKGGESWGAKTAEKMQAAFLAGGEGQKALVSGTIGTATVIDPNVVELPRVPRRLVDLIPTRGIESNTFEYVRQTVRTNNAAPVADNALKPTSVFTVEDVEDRVRVIAHLSEPVPLRLFADHNDLRMFLDNEMHGGVLDALEAQIASGSGVGENMTGILNTSGVATVAFATDMLTTIRKGLTLMQSTGVANGGNLSLLINPTDLEALDLLRADGATGQYLIGDPAGDSLATLWTIPRVPSTSVAAGTALLGDFATGAQIIVRENSTLAVDTSGDLFTHNQALLRAEGRFGLAVKRPANFAILDLSAA